MNRDEKLALLAAGNEENYIHRREALDNIKDKAIIHELAQNASDEWIKFEAAVRSGNTGILEQLKNHSDEVIRMESAIELNDQEVLKNLVLNSGEMLIRTRALKYISEKDLLKEISDHCNEEKLKVEAGIVHGDRLLIKSLFGRLQSEELKLRLARYIYEYDLLRELSLKASDNKIRKIAGDLMEDFNPDTDID
ncbi:MAG: hypothetical protein PVF73_12535 [Bacteroidales bacterium]|jgi:hypothetical protein